MNAIQLKKAMNEVLRDTHSEGDANCITMMNTILVWYYTTLIQPEDCIKLLYEFCTTRTLSMNNIRM